MTKEQCKAKLESIKEFCMQNPTLHSGVMFWKSHLTSAVECKVAYFEEYMEADSWCTDQSQFYADNDIPYATYLDMQITWSKGELF